MQNLSYENEFDLRENEPVDGTHFQVSFLKRVKRPLKNGLKLYR